MAVPKPFGQIHQVLARLTVSPEILRSIVPKPVKRGILTSTSIMDKGRIHGAS